jgi:hypothetical protein
MSQLKGFHALLAAPEGIIAVGGMLVAHFAKVGECCASDFASDLDRESTTGHSSAADGCCTLAAAEHRILFHGYGSHMEPEMIMVRDQGFTPRETRSMIEDALMATASMFRTPVGLVTRFVQWGIIAKRRLKPVRKCCDKGQTWSATRT